LKEWSFSMASKLSAPELIFLENETLLFALLACDCILFDLYFQFVPVIVDQKDYHAQRVACHSQGKDEHSVRPWEARMEQHYIRGYV
jgi:hypothetical protein